jgi:serine phosphatase RsbU (regulator of sigma subunit)
LRYAIRGYAVQGDAPPTILTKLSHLVSVNRDGHFATVLCGVLDVEANQVTFASAGHPPPLLLTDDASYFVETFNGVPIGVALEAPYRPTTITLPARATLLAYTDGLVERRREDLDVGFERLRAAAAASRNGSLDDLLTAVLRDVTPDGSPDDTAILGLQWHK